MQNISELERFLHDNACRNVLMPTAVGEKYPMFPHANNRWHWGLFARWNKKSGHGHDGIGILLQTLCVIDVDNMAIAKELELIYPFLKRVPAERTRKGIHYFFRRSALADRDGYYDSRSPVITAVDFKTVTSTGTSGFIVVAPSPNKTWIRPIWEFNEIPEIPDDILKAVARPAHAGVDIQILCADGKMFSVTNCRFARMSPYIKMFVEQSGFSDTRGVIHLTTYSWEVVSEAFDGLESGMVDFDSENIREILELFDYIGIPSRLVESIKQDSLEVHRIKDVQPQMANACKSFKTVTVDRFMARNLILQRNDDVKDYEIFKSPYDEAMVGLKSLRPDPAQAFEEALPRCVTKWMKEYPGKLVAAGGFVLGAVANYVTPGTDIDLYIVSDNEMEANAIVHRIAGECSTAVYTGYALTLTHPDSEISIQIILVLNSTASDILSGFDLHPCQVMGTYNGNFVLTSSATWVEALRDRCYPIHSDRWSDSSTMRIAKYCAKGFRAYIPGLCRQKVTEWTSKNVQNHMAIFYRAVHIWQQSLLQAVGVEQLFITECYLKRLGYGTMDHCAYSYLTKYARYMRKSDYQNYIKKTGIWSYVWKSLLFTAKKRWFNEYTPEKQIFWRTFHFKTKCVAINTRDSNIERWVGGVSTPPCPPSSKKGE